VTVVVNNVVLYGQLSDQAIVDGRNRNITYSFVDSGTVRAYLPHFWSTAEMDPNYSVLLGDTQTNSGATCSSNKSKSSNSKISKKDIILIAVLVSVGVIGIIVLIIVIYPRTQLRFQVRKEKRLSTERRSVAMSDLEIEKAGNMEVHTAAGSFHVRL